MLALSYVYTSSPSIVISASIGASDHLLNLLASLRSHPMIMPSVRTFMAIVTSSTGVLSLAITVLCSFIKLFATTPTQVLLDLASTF